MTDEIVSINVPPWSGTMCDSCNRLRPDIGIVTFADDAVMQICEGCLP